MYIKTIHMLDMTLIRYKLFDPGVNYMFISDIWVPSHAFVTTCIILSHAQPTVKSPRLQGSCDC